MFMDCFDFAVAVIVVINVGADTRAHRVSRSALFFLSLIRFSVYRIFFPFHSQLMCFYHKKKRCKTQSVHAAAECVLVCFFFFSSVCMHVAGSAAVGYDRLRNFFDTDILLNKKHQTTIIIVAVLMQQKVKIAINICACVYFFLFFSKTLLYGIIDRSLYIRLLIVQLFMVNVIQLMCVEI